MNRIAANVEAIAFFTRNDAFNNMFTQCGWNGGNNWETNTYDAATGWPTTASNRCVLRQSMNTQPGVYKLSFDCTASAATATVGGCAMSNRTSTDIGGGWYTIAYDATYTTGDMIFAYSGAVAGVGIRNAKFTHPGQATTDILNSEFRARAANFSGLRFYQAMGEEGYGVNVNNDKFWADRRLPGFATYCSSNDKANGIPYEAMIQMCNELNVDCYVNVPYCAIADTGIVGEGLGDGRGASTDDYVTKMARCFKYGSDGTTPYTSVQASPVYAPLNSGLKLYVEFGNELWNNFSYPYTRDIGWAITTSNRTAATYSYISTGYGYRPSHAGHMMMKISDLFRAVYGGSEMGTTVRCLSSGWVGESWSSLVMDYISQQATALERSVSYYVYAFAVAPYFNQHTGTATDILDAMAADAADTNNAHDNVGGALVRDITRAQNYGVKVVAYEGGIGNVAVSTDAIGRAVNTSSRAKDDVLVPYLTRWFAAPECETFFYYTMLKKWGTGSDWYFGLSESVTDETGPKWDAVKAIRAAGNAIDIWQSERVGLGDSFAAQTASYFTALSDGSKFGDAFAFFNAGASTGAMQDGVTLRDTVGFLKTGPDPGSNQLFKSLAETVQFSDAFVGVTGSQALVAQLEWLLMHWMPGVSMGNFIADGASVLPSVKTDARSLPASSDEWSADDANMLRQALIDMRAYLITTWPGGTSAPLVVGDCGGNTALINLVVALESMGLILNGTPNRGLRDTAAFSDSFFVARG